MDTGSFCKMPLGHRDDGVAYSGGPPESGARRILDEANDQGRCVAFSFSTSPVLQQAA